MADLGYVKTGQNFGKQLSGLGRLVKESRDINTDHQGNIAMAEAIRSGDMAKLSELMKMYPQHAEKAQKYLDIQDTMNENNLISMWEGSTTALNLPTFEAKRQYLERRRDEIEARGGNARNTIEALEFETEEELDASLRNAIILAERQVPSLAANTGSRGKFSAKTVFFNDGSAQMSDPDTGETIVRNPMGDVVRGEDRLLTLRKGRESGVRQQYDESYAGTMGSQTARGETEPGIQAKIDRAVSATKAADALVPQMQKMESNIRNYDEAIRLLSEEGAESGVIDSMMPSFRSASIQLDQIRNELGLDIVGAGKFGALSESELEFALSTALPDNLQPQELKQWLQDKRRVQSLLLQEMRKAQNLMLQGLSPGQVYAQMKSIPPGRTYEDVRFNMQKYGMTEDQVLEVMWQKQNMGGQ